MKEIVNGLRYKPDYSGKFLSYFHILTILQMGLDVTAPLYSDANLISYLDIGEDLLSMYAATCYLETPIPKTYLYDGSSLTSSFLRSLIYVKVPKTMEDLLALDYPSLNYLRFKGAASFWDDESFWREKLYRDFPNEDMEIKDYIRATYLNHYLTPSLVFSYSLENKRRLSLDYHTGRGLVVCRHYLLGEDADEILPLLSMRVAGRYYGSHGFALPKGLLNDIYCFPLLDDPVNSDNAAKELIMTEQPEHPSFSRRRPAKLDKPNILHIPNIFCSYAMEIKELQGERTFYLQFTDTRFFKGYLMLCFLLGVNPKSNSRLFKVK